MRKESPLMTIWDGDKLVGVHIHCPTAACPQPNRLEEELVRIFNEKIELEAENKQLKENLLYYRTHKNRGVECSCGNVFYAPFDDLDCPFCEEVK